MKQEELIRIISKGISNAIIEAERIKDQRERTFRMQENILRELDSFAIDSDLHEKMSIEIFMLQSTQECREYRQNKIKPLYEDISV